MDTIQTLISKSSVIYSEIEIKTVIQNIADQVNQTIKTDDLYVLCVMNGALIFAGQLLPRLEKNIQYSYIHASLCSLFDWRSNSLACKAANRY